MNGHDRDERTDPRDRGVGPAVARLAVTGFVMLLFTLPMLAIVGASVGSSGAGLPGWLAEATGHQWRGSMGAGLPLYTAVTLRLGGRGL